MGRRRVRLALVALLVTLLALVVACGGSAPPPQFTGTDNEDTAPPEARDVILNALETMFTWSPAKDASSADAYKRALPYLGRELSAGANNRIERGNSPAWQDWKAQRAEVTAKALLVVAEHPADKPDTVQRSVLLTQTVKAPDGRELDSTTFNIDRVVAKKGPQGWRVEQIAFFPDNPIKTTTCPPGQSHQPPPDGPCAPNPPPPPKQCPDGTAIAAGQACPPPRTGPQTKVCPNGTTVPAGSACPSAPGAKTEPSAGTTTAPSTDLTTAPETTETTPSSTPEQKTCPTGQSLDADGQCVTTDAPCPSGQTRDGSGTCQYPPCPSGQTRDGNGTCQYPPCPSGQTRDGNGTCQYPPCPSGQVRGAGGSCVYPPCANPDQTRNSSGTCVCPSGTVASSGNTGCESRVNSWEPKKNPPRVTTFDYAARPRHDPPPNPPWVGSPDLDPNWLQAPRAP